MLIIENKEKTVTPPIISTEKTREIEAISHIKNFMINGILTVLVAWVFLTFIFGFYIQNGEDMYPSIRDGDLVLFYRMDKNYVIDDILTFEIEDTRFTARYVAMSGDVVDISDEGQLIINGNIQQEAIFYATYQMDSEIEFPYTVPRNYVFVLGDFRTSAIDSRIFGAIDLSDIDGKIITIIRRRGL